MVADLRLRTKLLNVQLRTCSCGLRKLKFGCGFADCGLKKKLAVPSTDHCLLLHQEISLDPIPITNLYLCCLIKYLHKHVHKDHHVTVLKLPNLPRFGRDFFYYIVLRLVLVKGCFDFRERSFQPDKEIVFEREFWSLHINDSL